MITYKEWKLHAAIFSALQVLSLEKHDPTLPRIKNISMRSLTRKNQKNQVNKKAKSNTKKNKNEKKKQKWKQK